jgi:serine/threonine protein kinase
MSESEWEYSSPAVYPFRQLILPKIPQKTREEMDQVFQETTERLGFGRFGCVMRVNLKKNLSIKLAVKEVSIVGKGKWAAEEAEILASLQEFSHTVRTFGSFQCNEHLYVVMEMAIGDLEEVLRRANGWGLKEVYCAMVARHILIALDYMHHRKIVHRDICPANILVFSTGICKLGEFLRILLA